MSKPNIPNQKKMYNEQFSRIERYTSLLSDVYDKLNLEAANVAIRTGYDGEKEFKWSDYPRTRASIQNIQSLFENEVNGIIVNGITAEWEESNFVQDLLAKRVLANYDVNWKDERFHRYFNNNSDALKSFIQRKDKGMKLSEKIWNISQNYKESLEQTISLAASRGTSAITLSKQISQYLNDFPKLRKDYTEKFGHANDIIDCEYRSARLARTEINMAYRSAEQQRWQQMDFVVGYEVKRSGHPFPCKVCEALAGKYPKDFVFSGWHPSCRCYVIPILKTEDEFWDYNGSSSTKSVNEIKDVPDSFTQWVDDNLDRINEAKKNNTLPYFLRNNKKWVPR